MTDAELRVGLAFHGISRIAALQFCYEAQGGGDVGDVKIFFYRPSLFVPFTLLAFVLLAFVSLALTLVQAWDRQIRGFVDSGLIDNPEQHKINQ